jgi:hypothetical protein
MTRLLQDSIADGSLVLWHGYRAGHLIDLSGNGNDGVATGTAWANKGLTFPAVASKVTVADDASIQVVNPTFIWFGDLVNLRDQRLLSKRDAGGTSYELYLDTSGTRIAFSDGVALRVLATDISTSRMLALGLTSGEAGDVYLNGLFNGALNNVSTLTTGNADLIIGNIYSNSWQAIGIIEAVLIFNRKLTATEHAQVYSELHENGGPSS